MHLVTLHTPRLILRPWKESDLVPFAKLNADPKVTECLPAPLTPTESNALAQRFQEHFAKHGWGFWAVEAPHIASFIGFIGLGHVPYSLPFTPALELGWRLLSEYWGKGYAPEGAKAAIEFAFETLKLPEIVAFTTVANIRSRRVMEKIGMHHDPKDDFDHPKLPDGHPLQRHVLYRLNKRALQE